MAVVQSETVVKALAAVWPDYRYDIKARDTAAGDIDKVTPFKDMPVKNLWTHELETLMIEGKLDFLVHCLKGVLFLLYPHCSLTSPDVPTQIPSTCELSAVIEREDARDALVIKAGRPACKIGDLPAGSIIGTSSIRRTAQIALQYPHLVVKDLRGNIGTRLAKLDAEDGPFDAIILAAAGLIRIDEEHRISQYLDSQNGGMMYAVGQGALAIESRTDNVKVRDMVKKINHRPTQLETLVERSLLRTIEGGCSAPLGVETSWLADTSGKTRLELKAIVVSTDGKQSVEIKMTEHVETDEDAEEFGINAASELLHKGADKILAEIKAKRPTTVTDLEEK